MSELLNLIPYGAGVAGYAAAGAVDYALQQRTAANRQPNGEIHEDTLPPIDSTRHFIGRAALSPLAVTGGLAVGLTVFSLMPAEATPATEQVTVVVDGSGASAYSVSAEGVAPAETFGALLPLLESAAEPADVRVLFASEGQISDLTVEAAQAERPLGDAPLADALTMALGSAESGNTTQLVVLTDGNSIGDTEAIINQSNKSGVPVSIVAANETTDETERAAFTQIAEATGGSFQIAEEVSPEMVADLLIDGEAADARREAVEDAAKGLRLNVVPFAAAAWIAAALSGMYRKRSPLVLTDRFMKKKLEGDTK